MLTFGALADWVTAGAGIGAFIATGVLAGVAIAQMFRLDKQAKAQDARLDDQVTSMRDQVDAMKDQARILRETSANELATVREQVAAAVEQGNAIREAARAQLQPVVMAHVARGPVIGPADHEMLITGEIAFQYFLLNEGTGIALNITHGIEIGGVDYAFNDGTLTSVMQPGEVLPLRNADGSFAFSGLPLQVVRPAELLPEGWQGQERHYWARFSSVFGEKFETRNPAWPTSPSSIKRIDATESDPPE